MPEPAETDLIEIVLLTPDDWQAARQIRLEALRTEPRAFSSTYAEAAARDEAAWREWLSRSRSDFYMARLGDEPVGLVGGIVGADDDPRVGEIVSMYVAPQVRRRGVGQRLLRAAMAYLSAKPDITRLRLHVHAEEIPAQRLYASMGFAVVGEEEGELVMERPRVIG